MLQIDDSRSPAPPRASATIARGRVLELFRVAATRRVTLVVASAGFGKSVAVRQYLESLGAQHVRLSLRREHETLRGFITGFASAISSFAPDAVHSVAQICDQVAKSKTAISDIAGWVEVLLSTYNGTIVLDDLHRSSADPRICEVISEIVDRCSEGTRWIVSTRNTLTLPIASWLAYGVAHPPIAASDLSLTVDEASMVAASAGVNCSPAELGELLSLTGAWPAAFAFALHTSAQTKDSRLVAAGTRDMVYSFLAEQVLRSLSASERRFLLDTALFPALHHELLRLAGYSDPVAALERVRRSTGFVLTELDGVPHYHDLFKGFLENQLRLGGPTKYAGACERAARVLDAAGRVADALDLFTRAGSCDEIASLLKNHGFDLLDQWRVDEVERALLTLRTFGRGEDPPFLALRGYIDYMGGEYTRAESLFSRALSTATDPDVRMNVAHRYAALLTYPEQRYAEALGVLERVSQCRGTDPLLRARLTARKASLYSYLGRTTEAATLISGVVFDTNSMDPCSSTRLSILRSAIIVALNCGDLDAALASARDAAIRTEKAGLLHWTASIICYVLQATYDQGKLAECRAALQTLLRLAKRTGSRSYLQHYLVVAYDLAAECGDESALRALEPQLEKERDETTFRHASLIAVYALGAASAGDFRRAYALMTASDHADSPSHRLLKIAKRLFYAAAAGMHTEADECFKKFTHELNANPTASVNSFVVSHALALAALGSLLNDRHASCNRILEILERSSGQENRPAGQLARVVRLMYLYFEVGGDEGELAEQIVRLRSSPLGGYAKLLPHLVPLGSGKKMPFSTLTKVELQVLRLLSGGATSREVAATTSRSPHTIDSHVKAIARKLGCRGRREAIALARSRGIV